MCKGPGFGAAGREPVWLGGAVGPGSVPQSPVCLLRHVCLSEDADIVVGNIQAGEKEASDLA